MSGGHRYGNEQLLWLHSSLKTISLCVDSRMAYSQAAGARVGTIVEGATALILAHLIGFRFSWILTFVLMGVVPLYILSGWLHVKVSAGFAGLQQRALRDAARVRYYIAQFE